MKKIHYICNVKRKTFVLYGDKVLEAAKVKYYTDKYFDNRNKDKKKEDDELEKENIRFKNSLVEVFYNNLADLFGPVENVEDDSVDLCAKLKDMLEKIIADNEKYKQIYDAIVFLDNFEFNTRAVIIQTVRSQLSIINPLSAEYSKPEPTFQATQSV